MEKNEVKMAFENVESAIDWLSKNGEKNTKYYLAVSTKDSTVELSNYAIRKSKNKIVRVTKEKAKGQKWNSVVSEAFGGFVCKSTVIDVLGKKAANEVMVDMYADNPHYKCSEPMHLYFRDKIDILKQRQIESRSIRE